METKEATEQKYIWLKHYPKGISHEVNPDRYTSLAELMDEGLRKYADWPAYANMGKQISFKQLDEMSRQFASYLQNDLKLQKGDRLAIQMPNLMQYPVALFGALRAGLIVVNTNPLYTPREMEHQFKDSGVKAIVILANFAYNLQKVIGNTDIKHVIVTEIGDLMGFPKRLLVNAVVKYVKKMVPAYQLPGAVSFNETLQRGSRSPFRSVPLSGKDLAFIQYTGGTTGVSKGAMLTHRNIIANLEMNYEWMKPKLGSADQNIIITALPLYHVFSLTVNALTALKTGWLNVLITNPRDMKGFIKEAKAYPFTIITGLNTLFNGMLNHPDFGQLNLKHLQITVAGAMALQTAVAEKWVQQTGCVPAEGYGLSETSPVLSCNPIDGTARIGTIGLPFPSTELKAVKDDGTDVLPGESGELWARGPQVFPGYWNRPDETEKVFEGDWFKTGDIGLMNEDGFFRIVDRKKDMIVVSGMKVFPSDIEEVLSKCPGVLETACIGVPDEKSTEAVKLFVVKKDPNLTEDAIRAFCRENLTNYKRPKYIEFRDDLPKSNVGKILRRMLKDNA